MDEKELERLYNAVNSKFDVGDYNTFKSKMGTSDDRKKFYDAVGSKGFDLGDYNQFETRIGGKQEPIPHDPAIFPTPKTTKEVQADYEVSGKIPSVKDFQNSIPKYAQGNQPSSTSAPLSVKTSAEDFINRNAELAEKNKKTLDEAFTNTAKKIVAAKGRPVDDTKPLGVFEYAKLLEEKKKLEEAHASGDNTLAFDKDGKPGLKRTTGAWETFSNKFNEALDGNDKAQAFYNASPEERVAMLSEKEVTNKHPEYLGESPSPAGSVTGFVGENAPVLAKGAAGAVVGSMLAAAAPETGGLSMTGAPAAMAFLFTANDAKNNAVQATVTERYYSLLKDNPNMPPVEAMKEASKGELVGGITGILENALLTGTSIKLPLAPEGQQVVKNAIKKTLAASVHLGAATAGVEGLRMAEGNLEGYHTSPTEAADKMAETFAKSATVGALLHAITSVPQLPKVLKSAFKYALKDVPTPEIKATLQMNEQAGTIPAGTTNKVVNEIQGYKEASAKTLDGLSPDVHASVAGLIEAKNKLVEESKTKDNSFKPFYADKIAGIDHQIQQITESGRPYNHEVDEMSGNKYRKQPDAPAAEDTQAGIKETPPVENIPDKVQEPITVYRSGAVNNDVVYTAETKDYADQFAGEKGKKGEADVKEMQIQPKNVLDLTDSYNNKTSPLAVQKVLEAKGVEFTEAEKQRIAALDENYSGDPTFSHIVNVPAFIDAAKRAGFDAIKQKETTVADEYGTMSNNEKDLHTSYAVIDPSIILDKESRVAAQAEAAKKQYLADKEKEVGYQNFSNDFEKHQAAAETVKQSYLNEDKPEPKSETSKGVMKKAKELEIDHTFNPRDVVLKHFADGGKINPSVIKELYGGKNEALRQNASTEGERRSRIGLLNKTAKGIDELAHSMWEEGNQRLDAENKFTTQDYREAIEQVIQEHRSPAGMAKELVNKYTKNDVEKNLTEAESEVLGNEQLEQINKLADKMPENIKKEIVDLLDKYNNRSQIDWIKLEEDTNGFDPDILNLSEDATNYLEKILKENLYGSERENIPVENNSEPKPAEQGSDRQPEDKGNTGKTEKVEADSGVNPEEHQQGETTGQGLKELQSAHDKAVRELETATEKLAKEQATQTDIFGNATAQKGMFEQNDQKEILDPLKAKVKETKAALDKATKEAEVAKDNENPDLFPTEKEQKVIIEKMGSPIGEWLKRAFTSNRGLPEMWMVLKDLATGRRQLAARDMRKAIYNLQDAVKQIKYTDTDKISEALKDTNSTSFQSLPPEIQTAVKDMRLMVDGFSEGLVTEGLVTPGQALTISDHIGEYLNRSYKLHTQKDWIKKVDPAVKADAIKFLTQQRLSEINADPNHATKTAAERMDLAQKLGEQDANDILTKKDTPTGQRYTEQFSKDLSTLKTRQDIPEPIRKLMGEYTDPVTQFAITISKLATLHSQAKLLNSLRNTFKGQLFFEKDEVRPEGFNYQVASDGSQAWNPLAGLYTSKNAIEALQENAQHMEAWHILYQKAFGTVKKFKTVYSVPTQVVNFFANPFISLANGHFNLSKLDKSWDYYKDTMFNKERGSDDVINTLVERNVIGQSVNLRQIRDMLGKDKADEFALSEFIKPKKSNWNPLKWINKADNIMQSQYGASDSFWKVYGFMNEATGLSDALFGKKYKDLTGADKIKIDELASERIKNTYPTYDRALPALMAAGKNIPFVGNFMAFQAEVLRTVKNNILYAKQDLKDPNPKIKQMGAKRMAGLISYVGLKQGINLAAVMATGTAASSLWAAATGNDDEKSKRQSLDKFAPDFLQTHNLMVESKANGVYSVYDIDRLDPYNAAWQSLNGFAVGKDGGVAKAIEELAGPFVEPDMLLRAAMDINKNENFSGKPIYNTADTKERQFMDKMAYVYGVIEPTTAKLFNRARKADSPTKEVVASLFGARSYDIDVKLSFKSKVHEAEEKLSANSYFNYKDKEGTEKQELKDNFKRAVMELNDYYNSAVKLGASPAELNELLGKSFSRISGASRIKQIIKTGNVKDSDIDTIYKKKK